MNIEEFVSESLKQIINGVANAQKHAATKHAKINPVGLSTPRGEGPNAPRDPYSPRGDRMTGQMVDFDLAVAVAMNSSDKNSIQVVGGPVNLRIDADTKIESQTSRIRFSVSIFLPEQA